MDGEGMMENVNKEEHKPSIDGLYNFRLNRLGGVDADIEKYGQVIPTTLTDSQVEIIPPDTFIQPFDNENYQKYVTITNFKADRELKLKRASVTISTGKTFDADEVSISRLNNAIMAARNEDSGYIIPWSTADVSTGVMVDCTKVELEEAHTKAVLNMGEIWKI